MNLDAKSARLSAICSSWKWRSSYADPGWQRFERILPKRDSSNWHLEKKLFVKLASRGNLGKPLPALLGFA
jgi:hypothetical protein